MKGRDSGMAARRQSREGPRTRLPRGGGGRTGSLPRRLLAVSACAAACAVALPCAADDAQELELAKNRFDAGLYEEAHQRFVVLLDPTKPACDRVPPSAPPGGCRLSDNEMIERARAFDAVSLIALGREADADAQIAKILRQNPAYSPSPALFPPTVIDRFTVVRGKIREELEALAKQQEREDLARKEAARKAREADEKWIADLQKLAAEEQVVYKNSRWIALMPLGIGQYQNGDIGLGVLFTVSEALLGAASITSATFVNYYASQATERGPNNEVVDIAKLNEQISTAATVNRVTFGAWAAVTALGILQAQIWFVPERSTKRTRPVPPRPKAQVTMSVLPGGAGLGLVGTF